MDAREQTTAEIKHTYTLLFWTLCFLQIRCLPLKFWSHLKLQLFILCIFCLLGTVSWLIVAMDSFHHTMLHAKSPSENMIYQMAQYDTGHLSNRLSFLSSSFTSKHKTFPDSLESRHGLHSTPRSICGFNVVLSKNINAPNCNIIRQGLTQLHDN